MARCIPYQDLHMWKIDQLWRSKKTSCVYIIDKKMSQYPLLLHFEQNILIWLPYVMTGSPLVTLIAMYTTGSLPVGFLLSYTLEYRSVYLFKTLVRRPPDSTDCQVSSGYAKQFTYWAALPSLNLAFSHQRHLEPAKRLIGCRSAQASVGTQTAGSMAR